MSKRAVTLRRLLPVITVLLGGSAAAQGTRTTIAGQVTEFARISRSRVGRIARARCTAT
jgi:hypothetical protein